MTKATHAPQKSTEPVLLFRHSSLGFRHYFVIRDFVIRNWIIAVVFVFVVALATICCHVTGVSLDLFIAGFFIAALLAPPCCAIAARCITGICLAIATIWWLAVYHEAISIGQWSMCVIVLTSFAFLLTSIVQLLIRLKFSPVIASAIVTLSALAWLTWPIWLSSEIAGSQLHWSIVFHPILVINKIVSNLGIWTEQPIAYNLTNLGQDAQYQLPTSAWPLIAMQSGIAALIFFTTHFLAACPKGRAANAK